MRTFAELTPPMTLGRRTFEVTGDAVERYNRAIGLEGSTEVPLTIWDNEGAYCIGEALDMPAGIHAAQAYTFRAAPRMGDELVLTTVLRQAYERAGKRWIDVEIEVERGSTSIATALLSLVWDWIEPRR